MESAEGLGLGEDARRAVLGELLGAAGAGGMVGGQALDLLGEGEDLGEIGAVDPSPAQDRRLADRLPDHGIHCRGRVR